MTAAARIPLDDDADTWARVMVLASLAVTDGVDLDSIESVWRHFSECGISTATAINLAPAVIERAREIIAEQETAI